MNDSEEISWESSYTGEARVAGHATRDVPHARCSGAPTLVTQLLTRNALEDNCSEEGQGTRQSRGPLHF